MAVSVTAAAIDPVEAEATLTGLGLTPSRWSAPAGEIFGDHTHANRKILFCVDGEITFIADGGCWLMRPGDRLHLPAGTHHEAVAGPTGVTCVEAFTHGSETPD